MRTLRAHRRFAIWLAAIAVLFGAIAPSISHALGSSRVAAWMEVCSVQGATLRQVDSTDKRESLPTGKHLLEHCPYCSIHLPTLGVPASVWNAPLRMDLRDGFPIAFFATARTLHAWVSAQPRAPPLNS